MTDVRVIAWCFALAGVVLVLTHRASADVLMRTDGTILAGEVVSESRREVEFRCQIRGIWTTVKIRRGGILSLEREPGDQSDLGASSGDGGEGSAESGDASRSSRSGRGQVDVDVQLAPHVALVPLHGQVGGMVDDAVTGTFDARVLREALELAESRGAVLVVLDINSPGGLLAEMEAICETLIDWHGRVRIVAFPREAFSAAAIIALSCRELVVHPDSLIGAAVIVRQDRRGMSAVTAKMASPHHARQRQYMEASGHPYAVLQAMTIQPTELWWSPWDGFRIEEPIDREHEWEKLDDAETILTLTGVQAHRYGVAIAEATDVPDLLRALHLDPDLPIEAYHRHFAVYNTRIDSQLTRLRRHLDNYFAGLDKLTDALRGYTEAARGNDRDAAEQAKSSAGKGLAMALAAARQIRRADRSLLARRVEVPEAILERLDEDKKLIGKIKRLMDTDTVDGVNEAVDRINTVIEGWRELLG